MSYMQALIQGINRVTRSPKNVAASESGEVHVTQSAARYEEITRNGYSFRAIATTAAVGVVALPTVAANCILFNSAPTGGRSCVIDAVFGICTTHAATIGQFGLIVANGVTAATKTAAHDLLAIKLNGLGPTADNVGLISDSDVDLDAVTGVEINWVPVGPSCRNTVATKPGAILYAELDGRFIVPPQHMMGVNVMQDTNTHEWTCGFFWHEKQLTLDG